MTVDLVAHLIIVILIVIVLRRKVLIVFVVVHLVVLGLLSRFLEVDGLATCPTSTLDDVLGGNGFEAALGVFVFV